jgi:hypothetical protein
LFLSHNVYLNDVKDRAAFGVTDRNGAIQGCVNRPRAPGSGQIEFESGRAAQAEG